MKTNKLNNARVKFPKLNRPAPLADAAFQMAPEGIEVGLHLFIRADDAEAETCLHLTPQATIPPLDEAVDVLELIQSEPAYHRLLNISLAWRPMTRAEIQGYKLRRINALHA